MLDVMTIQVFGNMPAANSEMAIGDSMVARARSLIRMLQRMTILFRPDLSKRLNDVLNLLHMRLTWRFIRASTIVVRLYKKRPIQSNKFRKLTVVLQMELYRDPSQ